MRSVVHKRKHNSPSDKHTKTTRRRFCQHFYPTYVVNISTDFNTMETNPGLSPPTTTNGPCIEIPTSVKDIPTSDSYPPLIQSEGQALKYTYMCDKELMTIIVPTLANAITPTIERAVQTVFQQPTDTIKTPNIKNPNSQKKRFVT